MDVMITKANGHTFSLDSLGVVARDFNVSSIPIEANYGNAEGRHGTIDYGATYGTRTISVPFYFKAEDTLDYPLLRDELFGMISTLQPFYIRELRRDTYQTGDNTLVGGKRYLVRLRNEINLEQTLDYGFGELTFETTGLPFAESIGTTLDIERDGINADTAIWGYGMGLIADNESLRFTHTANLFRIYNAGNVAVHPFEQDLKITINNVVGSTSFLELRNETNGTVFRVNEAVTTSEVITLDGPNITINGLQALRRTNRKYIELSPGWNDFRLTGVTSARVTVDARMYYL